ncbi:glycine zipper domain-containing protein [Paenibacillus vulneris]|uniref:Glycine zipper domain-containing protein n=1 Tax=Paenibacillus vulneris TaxID=1133364 RepID=A0ABW3UFQ6_9BACL
MKNPPYNGGHLSKLVQGYTPRKSSKRFGRKSSVGTAGGGVLGALVGSALGPVGTIVGGIVGAAVGNKAGESVGANVDDNDHAAENHGEDR